MTPDARNVAETVANWILSAATSPRHVANEPHLTVLRQQTTINGFKRQGPAHVVADCVLPLTHKSVGPCFAIPVAAEPDESSKIIGNIFLAVVQQRRRLVVGRGWYDGTALVCDQGDSVVQRGGKYQCVSYWDTSSRR